MLLGYPSYVSLIVDSTYQGGKSCCNLNPETQNILGGRRCVTLILYNQSFHSPAFLSCSLLVKYSAAALAVIKKNFLWLGCVYI